MKVSKLNKKWGNIYLYDGETFSFALYRYKDDK